MSNIDKAYGIIKECRNILWTMNSNNHINFNDTWNIITNMESMFIDMKKYDSFSDENPIQFLTCYCLTDNILKLIKYRYDTIKSLNT